MKSFLRPAPLALALLLAVGATAAAMTPGDVLDLIDAGVGEEVILAQFDAIDARFALRTDDILKLKAAGASDALIAEMIRRGYDDPGTEASPAEASRGYARTGDSPDDPYHDDRDAHGGSISVRLYYDPFAYHWYPWPHYFTYYYPFSWVDCGFYQAGWWNYRWCGRGPWTDWYWDSYHWTGHHYAAVERTGRHAWDREPDGRRVDRGSGWGRTVSGTKGGSAGRADDIRPTERRPRDPADDRGGQTPGRRWTRSGERNERPAVSPPPRRPGGRTPDRPDRPAPPSARPAPSRPSPAPAAAPPAAPRTTGGGSRGVRSAWTR